MVNQVTLLGNLGQTPEVKTSANGKVYSRFLLATNEVFLKDGQKKERTDWHRVVAFGKLAEALKVLTTGDKVVIQGVLRGQFREHEGARSTLEFEVHAHRINFLKVAAWKEQEPIGTDTEDHGQPDGDDIPF
jgi:single-strand DNA-binding protein